MDVLGIDPSLTGTGVAKSTRAGVGTLLVRTVPTGGEHLTDTRDRIRHIVGQVVAFAPAECMSVIEAPATVRGGRGGAQTERAWLFGFLVDQMLRFGPVVQVAPASRAKYAVKGGASKAQVLAAMRERFPGVKVRDDNEADALALCAMGKRWMGAPIDGAISGDQAGALEAVRWPDMKGKR